MRIIANDELCNSNREFESYQPCLGLNMLNKLDFSNIWELQILGSSLQIFVSLFIQNKYISFTEAFEYLEPAVQEQILFDAELLNYFLTDFQRFKNNLLEAWRRGYIKRNEVFEVWFAKKI